MNFGWFSYSKTGVCEHHVCHSYWVLFLRIDTLNMYAYLIFTVYINLIETVEACVDYWISTLSPSAELQADQSVEVVALPCLTCCPLNHMQIQWEFSHGEKNTNRSQNQWYFGTSVYKQMVLQWSSLKTVLLTKLKFIR